MMLDHDMRRRWVLLGLASLGIAGPAPAQDSFLLDPDPTALVAEYREEIGGLEHPDPGPRVRLFAGGRVEIHIPAYLKGAGDFELQLERADLRAFVADLIGLGLVDFDPAAARAAIRTAEAKASELFASSDPSVSEFRLNLARFSRPDAASRSVQQRVRWAGLSEDARRHPSAPGLPGLDAARRRFEALLEHPALRAVEGGDER